MSQRELAEKTGIKQPMIARIEKFDSIPRLDTVIRIASALNMKLDLKLETNIYNDETIIQPNLIKDNSFYKANTLCEEITYNKKK